MNFIMSALLRNLLFFFRTHSIWQLQRERKQVGRRQTQVYRTSVAASVMFCLLNFILIILFICYGLSHTVETFYKDYIVPTIFSSHWRKYISDRNLKDEFTYYHRQCTQEDITTHTIDDIIFTEGEEVESISDKIMTHGCGIFPNVISEETASVLRDYILNRNIHLSDEEKIPLDGAEKRWSFSIEANEDQSVSKALFEIYTYDPLKHTLELLLGPNPAIMEITTITAGYGAQNQGYHPDVKPQGSPVQYSRTFTHTYSLFIPLQDVTPEMGATDVCPGTHYCADGFDSDLPHICADYGFQVSSAHTPWKRGNGMLINQCTWHRGHAHTDPVATSRVVFILTFANRPNPGVDHRQLSHGTYFHIRSDMYGHTFSDLQYSEKIMSWPFSILKSLGIWKFHRAQWGWDLINVMTLRIANDENGYTFEDLVNFVDYHPFAKWIPNFLQGDVLEEGSWNGYIGGCIKNIGSFCLVSYVVVVIIYMGLSMLSVICGTSRLWTIGRIWTFTLLSHLLLLFTCHNILRILSTTQWAKAIRVGTMYARPFSSYKHDMNPSAFEITPNIPTTVPRRKDVLFGTRFDSRFIGSYNNFLDYHPGNLLWHNTIESYSSLHYLNLPPSLQSQIAYRLSNSINVSGGRFLLQNEFGQWSEMRLSDVCERTKRRMFHRNNGIIYALDQEVSFLMADARFGIKVRDSSRMKDESLKMLVLWRQVFDESVGMNVKKERVGNVKPFLGKEFKEKSKHMWLRNKFLPLSITAGAPEIKSFTMISTRKSFDPALITDVTHTERYFIGDTVDGKLSYSGLNRWMTGKVVRVAKQDADIQFFGEVITLLTLHIRTHVPFVSEEIGELYLQQKCNTCLPTWLKCEIKEAYPDATYDIKLLSDGSIYKGVDMYRLARIDADSL